MSLKQFFLCNVVKTDVFIYYFVNKCFYFFVPGKQKTEGDISSNESISQKKEEKEGTEDSEKLIFNMDPDQARMVLAFAGVTFLCLLYMLASDLE